MERGDTEQAALVGGELEKKKPDWSRFGLSSEQQQDTEQLHADPDDVFEQHSSTEKNELFQEDQSAHSQPWWKSNFFVSSPLLFGTWDGVFTSCMINIFGVVIFLRTGWMVGNAGIGLSVVIILLTISVALVAAMSAIGVCERCHMESGGVYFLVSHVLGARVGAAIGILYCFGQAVACSLYVVGFGESLSSLLHQDSVWMARGIGAGIILLLLGINVAGVKWVIRLQLVLLMILFVAMLDFLVGSFIHTDIEKGFVGYSSKTFANNSGPSYMEGQSFFTVFGVFFPTATGVFAGINMSGDLKKPSVSIPFGTLSAVCVSTHLYLLFALVLGSTCTRAALQDDYMIAEKVSLVGVLFLAGLYISSVSSSMGGLYGSPRILQCIANENVIPIMKVLGQGRGPNKVPVFALIVVTVTSLVFVFIGKVNTLGPIVTMPFMLTYAAVDYAYFVLAMTFDKQKQRETRFTATTSDDKLLTDGAASPVHTPQTPTYGTISKAPGDDLDNLFPERCFPEGQADAPRKGSLGSPTFYAAPPGGLGQASADISRQPRSFYSFFCSRWLALLGSLSCVIIMFAIQWGYALANVSVLLIVYIYIGQANPGVFPGIAEFSMCEWFKEGYQYCIRRGPAPQEQVLVTPNTPAMRTTPAQLTEDSTDFAERGRYHQSKVVKGENFDDYN